MFNTILRNFIITFVGLLFLSSAELFAEKNQLKEITMSFKDWKNTFLTFQLESAPQYEIIENFDKKVLTVKFRKAKPNKLYSSLFFDGSVLAASEVEKISDDEFWVKIKTRFSDLKYTVLPRQKIQTNWF